MKSVKASEIRNLKPGEIETKLADAREEMMKRSGRTSVPQIWIGERHVGGFDDLAALDASGELDALLA